MQVVNPIRNDAVKDALPNPPPKSVTLKDPVLARFCLVEKLNDEASIESTVETEAVCSPTVMLKRRDLRTLSELLPISAESECHREKSAVENPNLGLGDPEKAMNPLPYTVI